MTKNHLNTSQGASDPPLTCDVDGIIAGLDYESFVLLPGTRNPRPGMKFAEDTEAPAEGIADYQMDYSAGVYETPSMPSMYFYPPYWGTPFVVASPRLGGKKSKKKNKKKRNKNKQRLQRLERESQLGVTTPTSDQSLSPLSSPNLSSKSPDSPSLSPKSDQKPNKKKRNKQRRRGSGRARRASAPQYMLHEGLDAMSFQFAGLGVTSNGEPASGFSKSGAYSPSNRYNSRHPPFWNQIPLYGQAY